MAVPPVLVVNMTFDPPTVKILGQVHDATIAKLNDFLPHLTLNSTQGRRAPPKFERLTDPTPHWAIELRGAISNDPSRMAFMLAVLDCLDEEGGWSMHDTHGSNTEFEESHSFFFVKKSR
jgi:hypothetical protein